MLLTPFFVSFLEGVEALPFVSLVGAIVNKSVRRVPVLLYPLFLSTHPCDAAQQQQW